MTEPIEIMCITGMGIFGIIVMCFINISDIDNCNEQSYWRNVRLYFKKAKNSYIPSFLIVFFYALTHEEWIKLFQDENSHTFVTRAIGLVMIIGFFVGASMQYGVYKWGLRKIDKIMKKWSE